MPWLGRLFSRMAWPRVWIPLVVIAVALALAAPHLAALYSWRAAEQDLVRHHARTAALHLERCLRTWPRSAAVHLLAARAARLLDDYENAERHLLECQQLETRPSDASLLEWGLLKAENGNLDSVEEFLLAQSKSDPARADVVLEAVAAGYLRLYRFFEAMNCLEECLSHDADNLRALYLRGRAWERVHAYPKAAADYQRVVAQDPDHDDARLRLANCHLENGEPAEALPHLELLCRRQPDNSEVIVRLAFARNALGQLSQGIELIDQVLNRNPELPTALSARGQLAYQAEQLPEAEYWLRKAIAANPYDRMAHYVLQQCLEQQGKRDEAEAQKRQLDHVEKTIARMLAITNRLLPKTPHDPALHHELGAILMRMGKEEMAVRWYHSALRENPDYRPAHEALAQYYERIGNAKQASWHKERTVPRRKSGSDS